MLAFINRLTRKSYLTLLLNVLTIFPASSQQLVLPGDYPDPSVTKIGDTYWATATSSNWFPAYPLLKSKDLINWEPQGYIFDTMPQWSDYYFWAPEISYENGKVYVYYSAHKKNGNLCIGVASADKPEGPYKDHGPLMCQEAGSIDAFPMRDENGKLFIIWKEDGNSVKKPTPIWANELNESRTALTGDKKELFRNALPWEGNLVEGVSMIRHGGYFYAFYAARGCCGIGCNYVTGIARSKKLLGPWEKYEKGPVIDNFPEWVCPGHGTPIEKDGKFYFLYHAYNKESHAFTGREGILSEFVFTPDGWIKFIVGDSTRATHLIQTIKDDFSGQILGDRWQWSVFQPVIKSMRNGELTLMAIPTPPGAYVGTKVFSANYKTTILVNTKKSNASPGLALIGDDKNLISIMYDDNKVSLFVLENGKETFSLTSTVKPKKKLYLTAEVVHNKNIHFYYSTDGKKYKRLTESAIDCSFLPPWDRAVRVGLISKGAPDQKSVFDFFELINTTTNTHLVK